MKWIQNIIHKMTGHELAPEEVAKNSDKFLVLKEIDNISFKLFQLNERLRDESVGKKIRKGFW